MTKTEKSIYIDIIMGAKEIDLLPNGKIKNITNVKSLKQQELIDIVNKINKQFKNPNVNRKIDISKIPHKIKNPNTGEIFIFSHLMHGQPSYMKTVFAKPGKAFEHVTESDLYMYEILEQNETKSLWQELEEKYRDVI